MDIEKFIAISDRMIDLDEREKLLFSNNDNIVKTLSIQNEHVEKLFKGYIALGIVEPENDDMVRQNIITEDEFLHQISELENQFLNSLSESSNTSDKFEAIKKLEIYITKSFDLTGLRWESIVKLMEISLNERIPNKQKSIELMGEYKALHNSTRENWHQVAEDLFKRHIEMLDFQELHLSMEESFINDCFKIIELRQKLIEIADEAFK